MSCECPQGLWPSLKGAPSKSSLTLSYYLCSNGIFYSNPAFLSRLVPRSSFRCCRWCNGWLRTFWKTKFHHPKGARVKKRRNWASAIKLWTALSVHLQPLVLITSSLFHPTPTYAGWEPTIRVESFRHWMRSVKSFITQAPWGGIHKLIAINIQLFWSYPLLQNAN
jgi:hypothetical protein